MHRIPWCHDVSWGAGRKADLNTSLFNKTKYPSALVLWFDIHSEPEIFQRIIWQWHKWVPKAYFSTGEALTQHFLACHPTQRVFGWTTVRIFTESAKHTNFCWGKLKKHLCSTPIKQSENLLLKMYWKIQAWGRKGALLQYFQGQKCSLSSESEWRKCLFQNSNVGLQDHLFWIEIKHWNYFSDLFCVHASCYTLLWLHNAKTMKRTWLYCLGLSRLLAGLPASTRRMREGTVPCRTFSINHYSGRFQILWQFPVYVF